MVEWRLGCLTSKPEPEPRASTLYEPITYTWPTETILVSHNGQTKLLRRTSLHGDHGQGVEASYTIVISVRDLHYTSATMTQYDHSMYEQLYSR